MVEDNPTIGNTKANYEPLCDIHFASFFLYPSIYIIGTIMYPFFCFTIHHKKVCSSGLIVEIESHQCLNAY
jgi:hypothetical protein